MTILILGNKNLVYNEIESEYWIASDAPIFSNTEIDYSMLLSNDVEGIYSANDIFHDTNSLYSVRMPIDNNISVLLGLDVSNDLSFNTFSLDVSSDTTSLFAVGGIGNNIKTIYSLMSPVHSDISSRYKIKLFYAASDIQSESNILVDNYLESSSNIREFIKNEISVEHNIVLDVESEIATSFDIMNTTFLEKVIRGVYTIYDPTSESIVNTVVVTVDGIEIDFENINLSIDEDSYCWTFSAQLSNLEGWVLCSAGKDIIITIGSDVYNMKIDSRNRSISFGEDNFSIEGRSITSKYGEGAEPLYNTWGAISTHTLLNELIDSPIINIPLWNLTEDLFVANGETPISLVNLIADAVGGCVYTNSEGILIIDMKYKVAPSLYDINNTDHTVTDLDDIYSISESRIINPGYNQVEVSDEPDSSSNSVSVEVLSKDIINLTAQLKIIIFPFVNTVELKTSHDNVDLPISDTPLYEELTETIEIIDGNGSVSQPVYNIVSTDYQDVDLGNITFNGNDIVTDIKGLTLLNITYNSQYHVINITAQDSELIQIYLEEL